MSVAFGGLMAMLFGGGANAFVEACFNVPTLGFLYKTATLDALRERGENHISAAPTGTRTS